MKKNLKKSFLRILNTFEPPKDLNVSEWADENIMLSKESSAEPGRWRTDRAPYQKEILNSINDSKIEKIVLMTSSQIGKSVMCNVIIGYFIDLDPGPMLFIQPTVELAKSYSKERIAPMIRDTKCLTEKVSDAKTRDSDNTILMKNFPGGFLALGGANSPAGLASRPIRILLADEIDRYPVSAGTEGDPLSLVERRTTTFWNKKKIFVSTPTIKGMSRIEYEYQKGTMEVWKIECPHCGDPQYLNIHGMKFEHSKNDLGKYEVSDVFFQCPACLEKANEFTWKKQKGEWIKNNPDAKGVRSFHLNAFVSPWGSWEAIIKEWLESKHDEQMLKVVVNTLFGQSFEISAEIDKTDFLMERREEYQAEIPEGVLLLTCGVDTQGDRLEYEIVGWGRGEQSWGIKYDRILGKPDNPQTWEQLENIIFKEYSFIDGSRLKIACTFIDSGGHNTTDVYKFTKKHEQNRIYSIKGHGGEGLPFIHRYYRSKRENALVVILGVDGGKSNIISRLKIKQKGDGFCNFPLNTELGYDRIYFEGLTSEKLVKRNVRGQPKMVWEKIKERNEPFDVRNYAFCAMKVLNVDFDRLNQKINNAQSVDNTVDNKQVKKKRRGVVKKGID